MALVLFCFPIELFCDILDFDINHQFLICCPVFYFLPFGPKFHFCFGARPKAYLRYIQFMFGFIFVWFSSHNIHVERLLCSRPWVCRGWLLESSFSDPPVPPDTRCCCLFYTRLNKRLSRECVYWKAIITTQRYLGLGGGGEGKKSPRYCNKFNEKARCPDASERAFSLNLLRCLWGMGGAGGNVM